MRLYFSLLILIRKSRRYHANSVSIVEYSGKTLTIKATGTFARDIEPGAKVFLQVKYGLITLIKQEADLCDQIENVDMHCPLEEGKMTLLKDVDLPKEIPPVSNSHVGSCAARLYATTVLA